MNYLSIMEHTAASPVTFTAVRSMSNGRSTPNINARPSTGMPTEVSTIAKMT